MKYYIETMGPEGHTAQLVDRQTLKTTVQQRLNADLSALRGYASFAGFTPVVYEPGNPVEDKQVLVSAQVQQVLDEVDRRESAGASAVHVLFLPQVAGG